GSVPRREAHQLAVFRQRKREVAPADPDRAVQLLQPVEVEMLLPPFGAEGRQQRLLVRVVRRQRGLDGEEARAHPGMDVRRGPGFHRASSSGSAKRTSRWPAFNNRSGTRKEFCTGQQAAWSRASQTTARTVAITSESRSRSWPQIARISTLSRGPPRASPRASSG